MRGSTVGDTQSPKPRNIEIRPGAISELRTVMRGSDSSAVRPGTNNAGSGGYESSTTRVALGVGGRRKKGGKCSLRNSFALPGSATVGGCNDRAINGWRTF